MSNDSGDLPSAISGAKFFTIMVIALLLLPVPFFVKSCRVSEENKELSNNTKSATEFIVGSASEPTVTKMNLTKEWSTPIKIWPGNKFNVVPESGKHFELLPQNSQEPILVEYSADIGPYNISSFQMRGDGIVVIYTTP